MSMATIQPQSGVQLIILIGAVFILAAIQPLGTYLLVLGVGMWLIYNILNLGRQF